MRNILFIIIIISILVGCTQRVDIAKVYTGPCWMDPDTTGP